MIVCSQIATALSVAVDATSVPSLSFFKVTKLETVVQNMQPTKSAVLSVLIKLRIIILGFFFAQTQIGTLKF